MQFCDECGSMMVSQSGTMTCTGDDCGGTTECDEELTAESVSTEAQSNDELIETEEGAEFKDKSAAKDVHCDDCSHTKAWYTVKQTGSADESPTRFFKCQECGYRWREYNQIRT